MEGDFGFEFGIVQGFVYPCQNRTDSEQICQPQEVIDETLKDNNY